MNLPTTPTNPYEPSNVLEHRTVRSLRRLPLSLCLGLLCSTVAIGLWSVWCFTGWLAFLFVASNVKYAILATPFMFYRDLSKFLYQRTRLAVMLGLTLIGVTILAAGAYLPFRESFLREFNSEDFCWYSTSPGWNPSFGNDKPAPQHKEWLQLWNRGIPHITEVIIAIVYFSSIVLICSLRRLKGLGCAALALGTYAWLIAVPMLTGLFAVGFGFIFRGIIFDSISADLFPLFIRFAGPHSIFLFVFCFLFYIVCAVFMYANPRETEY